MMNFIYSFLTACRGKKIWRSIKHDCKIDKTDRLILAPESDSELNRCAAAHLRDFMERKHAKRAVVVGCDKNMLAGFKNFPSSQQRDFVVDIVCLDNKVEMESLCKYYRLVQFHDLTVVVSLEEPYASKGLLNREGMTTDVLVQYTLFGW